MKYYHPIGQIFPITTAGGRQERLVAVECESYVDPQYGCLLRKTCDGCVFAYKKRIWVSGRNHIETECREGGCAGAKCSPEYREDKKYIHYKRVVPRKSDGKT